MRRSTGISRNRLENLQLAKNGVTRKKNIFKVIGKEDQFSEDTANNTNHLLSATTKTSSHSADIDHSPSLQIYDQAKAHLKEVCEYRNKMTAQIKLRISAFKDSEIRKYQENISKCKNSLKKNLLQSEKILASIKKLKSYSETEEKFFRGMERSLALQIREASRGLRAQEKQYFDRLKAYEMGSQNEVLRLRENEREAMKDEYDEMEVCETEYGEDQQRNKQITDLVKSINQLSSIYKQLNELVINQGSLIDRIDFNIEESVGHVERGVKHLQGAEEHASNSCASKCMCILILLVIAMACVIGFKMAK